MIRPGVLSATVVFVLTCHPAFARAQSRVIQARDGDLVQVPTEATITVVRSMPGHIKVAAHEQGRILIVLLDEGPQPDGIVDWFYRYEMAQQPYPPDYLFDGAGAFEEYETLGHQRGTRNYGIVLPQGRIWLVSFGTAFRPAAVAPEHIAAFQFKGGGSRRVRATFADAEREALTGASSTGIQSRLEFGAAAPAGGIVVTAPSPDAPVRVGGNIRQPAKIKDVAPVMPASARQTGVFGVVILELTIDTEGRVSNARVLRSIPLLDKAALDAVQQWEFAPTYVDGRAVPVIMTVTVPFEAR